MDEEQVAGEVKIFGGEFAGCEFQLDCVVCDDTGLNGLVRARLPDHDRFRPRNLDRERLDRRKRPILLVAVPRADKVKIVSPCQGRSRGAHRGACQRRYRQNPSCKTTKLKPH